MALSGLCVSPVFGPTWIVCGTCVWPYLDCVWDLCLALPGLCLGPAFDLAWIVFGPADILGDWHPWQSGPVVMSGLWFVDFVDLIPGVSNTSGSSPLKNTTNCGHVLTWLLLIKNIGGDFTHIDIHVWSAILSRRTTLQRLFSLLILTFIRVTSQSDLIKDGLMVIKSWINWKVQVQ